MSTSSATIRRRRDEDMSALAEILVRVHALDGYPVEGVADPQAWLRPAREVDSWTAEVAGTPIGQITLINASPDDDAARVWHTKTGRDVAELVIPVRLFVDPNRRGLGAARMLMTATLDHARSLGRPVAFDVLAKDRGAIHLYEQLGARKIADITHHYGDGLTAPAFVYTFPSQ